jgi:FkbM family methyltransferase
MIGCADGSEFSKKLSGLLISSLENHHANNFDFERYPGPEREIVNREKNLAYVFANLEHFSKAYDLFEDGESKELFVLLVAFKILGHRKIRLPLSNKDYWELREKLNRFVNAGPECLEAGLHDLKLHLTDLNVIGVPIRQFTLGGALLIDFILKQYEYTDDAFRIGVKPGDVVIDAGACWGDTALYFANLAGPTGKVFSFEFTENVDIFKKNIALNPALASRITLIEKALWKNSHDQLFFNDCGPGTNVSATHVEKNGAVQAITIDRLVTEQGVEKIDFIKMDIEGAEQAALTGARETLSRWRPQLAITVYHNEMEDFTAIPRMLAAMELGYKFYLGHYTTYGEETVLFAKV